MPGMAQRRARVIIIGGGFGGIAAAQRLRREPVDLLLIDRHNHYVFQPLLYQVASATLAPSDVAVPIRWYLRNQSNTRVLLAEVTGVNLEHQTVELDHGERGEPFDYLVVAAGSRHSYFAHPEWERYAPGLKSLSDALTIRDRFLTAFEEAERSDDPEIRRAWQTLVIVGGGPTGAELAGVMATIAHHALRRDFRRIDTAETRVILVEGGPRLLASMPEELSARALGDLQEMGVEVRLGQHVSHLGPDEVMVGDEVIKTQTVFWAAGNQASPLGGMLGAATDRAGRVLVEPDLSIKGYASVFVVGDMAVTRQPDGQPVPGVAQGAIQGGRCAAENIVRTIRGQSRLAFRYQNRGDMATLGRHRAVADLPGGLRFGGWVAWFLWLFLHIGYLAGFRNRLVVLVQWAWEYLTWQRGVRLILGTRHDTRRRP